MTHKKQMAYADADAYNVGYQAGKQTAELNYKAQLQTIAEHIFIGRPVTDQDAWRQYAAAYASGNMANEGDVKVEWCVHFADAMLAAEKQRFEKEKVSE